MATLETQHEFAGDIQAVFKGISNYTKYPEYIPGVTKIEVLPPKAKGSVCQVRYEINIIKSFYYTIDMFEKKPNKIWWKLADSNLMKQNDGSWELKKSGDDAVEAVYSLEVKFKGFVPSTLTDQIAKANLPAMMKGFQKLIKDTK